MNTYLFSLFLTSSLMTSLAFANGGLVVRSAATAAFQDWVYAALAIGAAIYMFFKLLLAWTERIRWVDLLYATGKVALTGGVPALATYLWGAWA